MTPGALARRLLGSRFRAVGEVYRRVFVDLNKVADAMAAELPPGARCLDVGGGDGALAEVLLRRRPDLRITLIDLAADVGGFLSPAARERVEIRPATPLSELTAEGRAFDAVILADVMHHVPVDARAGFLGDLRAFCAASGCRLLIVKDVEPGGVRARLSYLSDHFITGDRNVSLIAAATVRARLEATLGGELLSVETTVPDAPNYCLVARLKAPAT